MKIFAVLSLKRNPLDYFILLVQETEFSTQAKITNTEKTNFLKNVLPSKFNW